MRGGADVVERDDVKAKVFHPEVQDQSFCLIDQEKEAMKEK